MLLTAASQNEFIVTVMFPLYIVYTGYTVINGIYVNYTQTKRFGPCNEV
jgi:hypothetical protein